MIARGEASELQKHFESAVEGGRYQRLAELQRIVQRGSAVGGIQELIGKSAQTVGTGFLISTNPILNCNLKVHPD